MSRSKKKAPKKATPGQAPKSPVTVLLIEGRVPRPLTYMLDHEHYCKTRGQCFCKVQNVGTVVQSKKHGAASPVFKQKRVPATVTFLFRKNVQVHPAVLSVPVIDAARRSGEIRVTGKG